MTGRVGLVFVSHSAEIATGLVALAGQMAPATTLLAAGGTDEGGIGTSFEKVSAAIVAADQGAGVVVIGDLGSAILTAETALEMLGDAVLESRVRILDVPIVEGGVAASVAAEAGEDLDEVVAAARSAAGARGTDSAGEAPATPHDGMSASATVTLVNRDGLHARPAAEFVKLASRFDATITVNGVDAKSLLRIMSLGVGAGAEVTIAAEGREAEEAVDQLVGLTRSGFVRDSSLRTPGVSSGPG